MANEGKGYLLRTLKQSRQHGRQDREVGHDSRGDEGVIRHLGGRLQPSPRGWLQTQDPDKVLQGQGILVLCL